MAPREWFCPKVAKFARKSKKLLTLSLSCLDEEKPKTKNQKLSLNSINEKEIHFTISTRPP